MKIVRVTEIQKQFILIGGVALALLVSGFCFFALPALTRLAHMRVEISRIDDTKALLEQSRQYSQTLEESESSLLKEKDRHLIFGSLANLAKSSGLEAEFITPEDPSKNQLKESLYQHFFIRMKVTGSFTGFLRFLGEVEKMRPPLAVTKMSMEQERRAENKRPSFTFVFKTLLLKAPAQSELAPKGKSA